MTSAEVTAHAGNVVETIAMPAISKISAHLLFVSNNIKILRSNFPYYTAAVRNLSVAILLHRDAVVSRC
jgi:hypothetical protein